MSMLLIRIGKAWNVLRRDGFLSGGVRIVRAFSKMFQRVGSGDILFITNGVGDSALYRAHHQAEELKLHGFRVSTTIQDNPLLVNYASRFKIFVFHRTLFSQKINKLINEIKKQNKEIIFDTDDLVFDSIYIKKTEQYQKMNSLEKKLYKNGLGGEIVNDLYVKVATVSTSFLAQELKKHGKNVFISANKLSDSDLKIADEIERGATLISNKTIKIGYFSGTSSHNQDFATITDALLEVMEKHPKVELFLVGPLELENKLNKFKNRVGQLSYVHRGKHFRNVASVDINIVPLEVGDPFCESKSELKFFEAGIVGVSTVAAATQTFKEAIVDGVDGFVANGTAEWVEKLEKLITDADLRKSMGEKARAKTLAKYTIKNSHNEEYYNYLRSRL